MRVSKKELTQLITESIRLIQVYTITCFKFMHVNGDKLLATWIQFGLQETKNIVNRFPSLHYYLKKYTGPEFIHEPNLVLDNTVMKYTRRFVKHMKTTKHEFAVKTHFHLLHPHQPPVSDHKPSTDILHEIRHNRLRNTDLPAEKIEMINKAAMKADYPIFR